MSILSGKDGTLYLDDGEVTQVTNWRIRKISRNKSYTANDTGGSRKRVSSTKDCSGRFEIKASDTSGITLEEGDLVTLQLHVDDSAANYYQVPAVVDALSVAVDISEGEPVGYVVEFSGNGPMAAYGILQASPSPGSSGG